MSGDQVETAIAESDKVVDRVCLSRWTLQWDACRFCHDYRKSSRATAFFFKLFPLALSDDFDFSVDDLDVLLIVYGIQWHLHAFRPVFHVLKGSSRKIVGIQVGAYR